MIGFVLSGRYEGGRLHRHSGSNMLLIETHSGEQVVINRENTISIEDVTEVYSDNGERTLMVIWNDFETSLIRFGPMSSRTYPSTASVSAPKPENAATHTESKTTPRFAPKTENAATHTARKAAPVFAPIQEKVKTFINSKSFPEGKNVILVVVAVLLFIMLVTPRTPGKSREERELEQAREAAKSAEMAAAQAEAAYDPLTYLMEKYEKGQAEIMRLTPGSTEYELAVQRNNNLVKQIIREYPEMGEFIIVD